MDRSAKFGKKGHFRSRCYFPKDHEVQAILFHMTERKTHRSAIYLLLLKKRHYFSAAEIQLLPFLCLLFIKDPKGPEDLICKLYYGHAIGSNDITRVYTGHGLVQVFSRIIRAVMF